MNHFRIGGKVVCIYGGLWYRPDPAGRWVVSDNFPVLGQVYTIADIRNCFPGLGLILEEIGSDPSDGNPWRYDAKCFKPLIERATDISALLALQNPKNHTTPLPEDNHALERALLEIFDDAFP